MKIILKCKFPWQFLIGYDLVSSSSESEGTDNICQLNFLLNYQILLSGKYRTMRWIKTCPRKMFFCRFRQIKVGRWSICLPCSPCLFSWEVKGWCRLDPGLAPPPPESIWCWRPWRANREGILGISPAPGPPWPPPLASASNLLPCGVLGGVGGWWETGGRFPWRAADSIPGVGWEKAGTWLLSVPGLSAAIKL